MRLHVIGRIAAGEVSDATVQTLAREGPIAPAALADLGAQTLHELTEASSSREEAS